MHYLNTCVLALTRQLGVHERQNGGKKEILSRSETSRNTSGNGERSREGEREMMGERMNI